MKAVCLLYCEQAAFLLYFRQGGGEEYELSMPLNILKVYDYDV